MEIETGAAGIFRELHAAVVPVRDLEAARGWYEKVLGLRVEKEVGGFLAVYGTGGPTRICLYVPEPGSEQHGQGTFPNWRARDIDATREYLVERGVDCSEVGRGDELSWFSFRDPDGNRHDVCEYTPAWLP
jgi:catechol 2,3-dioxygenase-like lactoylglutathione lyase family enzyme